MKSILFLSTALTLATATPLSARTWTDAASGRTIEGTYVSADADHVVIDAKGRALKIAIAKLSDADKAFISEQSAESGGKATDPFTRITPPVSVKSLPVQGLGEDRKSGLEATFEDSPGAATYSPLTAAQTGSRKEVSGGNWTVSFEEELYLGFAVQTTKEGKTSQQFYWSSKPSRSHKFHYDHHDKGGEHEVTFSPAGDGSSGITSRFSDPPASSSQSMLNHDLEIRPAGGRIGPNVRGPVTLYSLKGLRKPVFVLRIVFTKDTAAAEQSLREAFDR